MSQKSHDYKTEKQMKFIMTMTLNFNHGTLVLR
jgi:hypothetical protein